jgi:aerobic carbon-monoxide dehydrogenase large subunit
MSARWIGRSVPRKEDRRLVRGEGRYVGDVPIAGAWHAAVLRSPLPHARIVRVAVERARKLPGVVCAVTAADLGPVGPIPSTIAPRPALGAAFQPPMPADRVRYVGEPLAVVVARDRYVAEDALELIDTELEPLPVVADARAAAAGGIALHDPLGSNVADVVRMRRGDAGRVVAEAPRRLRASLAVQRHTGVPMEPRGLLASFEPGTGQLTVWGATKMTQRVRTMLADLLGYPERSIRLVETDIGGGFGLRGEFYPEDFLVPWLAMRLGAPVRWTEDRREHFLATNHSRQQWHDVEVGFTDAGRLLALVDRGTIDMGAYLRPNAFVAPDRTAAFLPGPYRVEHFDIELACVMTNKTPVGSYRGPGRVESTFVRERVMDLVARDLGRDPAEIRRRNLLTAADMPYAVGTTAHARPVVYDTGDYAGAFEALLDAFGYRDARADQAAAARQGRHLGIGLACAVDSSGVGPWETARVAIDGSGAVVLYSGTASLGQGIETTLAQICAEELGVTPDDVTVVHGDTALVPVGIGAFGSRGAVVGGSATLQAARTLRQKLLAVAARALEADPADLALEDGRVAVRGFRSRSVSFGDLARAALPGSGLPEGMDPGLDARAVFTVPEITYPYGMDAALVDVDPETGHVRVLKYVIVCDVGRAINPMVVEGQMVGGMVQGIGAALLEDLAYDEQGQLLTTTFMDYLLPTAMEVPAAVDVRRCDDAPSPHNPLGAKGAGEGGIIAVPAAIANAVEDALRAFGVTVTALPLSPDRVRALVASGGPR